jgi:hypothetical protein
VVRASERSLGNTFLVKAPTGRELRRDRRGRECGRGSWDAGGRVDLRLVEAFMKEELGHDRVEPVAVLPQQSPRFRVTLVRDPANLFVDRIEEAIRD